MRPEFQVHLLNSIGIERAEAIGKLFSDTLDGIEALIPAGRERSLVVTKLQEASFFAKRAIAIDPNNQRTQKMETP